MIVGFVSFVFAQSLPDLIFVQIPSSAESNHQTKDKSFNLMDRYVNGSRIMLLIKPAKSPKNLTPEFAAACDPDISFDGLTILFAGKKNPKDNWQIWQMQKDGSKKKQITQRRGNCISPIYAGNRFFLNDPQPSPQIIYVSDEHGWKDIKTGQPVFSLYSTDLNGTNIFRLTFNLHSDFSPDILPYGRVVFSSWQRLRHRNNQNGILALFEINIDGTDLMPFFGNYEIPDYKEMMHVSAFDDRVYFIESEKSSWLGGGAIAYVSKRRPLKSYQKLIDGNKIIFHSPCSLPDGSLLASGKTDNSNAVFSIYKLDSNSGKIKKKIVEEKGWHSIDTQLLLSHPNVKGKSHWLIPNATTGVFYCLNSYKTNLTEIDEIEQGTIKYLRVIEGIPNIEYQTNNTDSYNQMEILGTAPVEEDGSFHIKVPAETPITFQLLDKDYLSLRTQRTWTWVMRNENRGCIGCHEDRELAPPNKLAKAVLKPAVDLTTSSQKRRFVDFRNQIAPIILEKCASCHSSNGVLIFTKEQVKDDKTSVYQMLTQPIRGRENEQYVYPRDARSSPLIWHLFDKKLTNKEIPYSGKIDKISHINILTESERIRFIEWVDLGAQSGNQKYRQNEAK